MKINEYLEVIEKEIENTKINIETSNLGEVNTNIKKLDKLICELKSYLCETSAENEIENNIDKYKLNEESIERLARELKWIRFRVARENSIQAWKVFTNQSLEEYLKILPRNEQEFFKTKNVSRYKYDLYGRELSKAINDFIEFENNDISQTIENFDNILNKAIFIGERKICTNNEELKHLSDARRISGGSGTSKKGTYFSNKMQKEISFDSELERKFIVMLEKSEKVKYYVAQPYEIRYQISYKYCNNGKYEYKRYYPDFLVIFQDDTRVIVEVKNYFDLVSIRSKMKYELIKKITKEQGVGYIITTNGKHTLEEAIKYKFDANFEREVLEKINKKGQISYREYVNIRSKYSIENHWILPFAYKNNIFFDNNILAKLEINDVILGNTYTTMTF